MRALLSICDIASEPAKPKRMTKPKIFDRVISLRLPPGAWERIEALRGTIRQGDFLRDLLMEALERAEGMRKKKGSD